MKRERVKKVIEKLDDDLNGVAFAGGKKYVCARTLPDEEVLMEVTKTSGNAVVCTPVKVLKESSIRIRPKCEYFGKCGGCSLMMTSYQEQLKIKTALVKRKMAGVDFIDIDNCVPSSSQYSRNKVHICFEEEEGFIRAGFFDEDSHKVQNIEFCIMHGEWYHDLIKIMIAFIKSTGIKIYSPKTGTGILRFAVARKNESGIQVTLVETKFEKANYKGLFERLQKRFGEVSLYVNINDRKTNEVLSENFIHIAGNKTLSGEIASVKYELSPNSFMQTNFSIAERIYLDVLKKVSGDKVVDLFSGIGITSTLFAKGGKSVESVEIVDSAVQNAKRIAEINNVAQNIKFHTGDALKVLKDIDLRDKSLFVDPPRAGLTSDVIDIIKNGQPKEIVYLSCSLKTLVDDLKSLTEKYKIKSVTPYDMFPQTKHIETLVVLNKE